MIILRLLMGRNTIKILIVVFLSIFNFYFLIFNLSAKAFADTSCQPIYGGGQSCIFTNNIIVDKTVLNPQTNQFVDNLSVSDPKYQPDFIITFKIKVTNTGNNTFSNIQIKDIFPQYVLFSFGPGVFDENTKTLTFSINDLKANESRTFTIVGRMAGESVIPLAAGNICVVNQAMATTNTNEVTQDNSQFCIEKKSQQVVSAAKGGFPVFPATNVAITPSTGPEMLGLIALVPTGIAGWFLRKKSYNNNNSNRKGVK